MRISLGFEAFGQMGSLQKGGFFALDQVMDVGFPLQQGLGCINSDETDYEGQQTKRDS